MDRTQAIQALRDAADFLEANPDAPLPSVREFNVYTYSQRAFLDAARRLGAPADTVDHRNGYVTAQRRHGNAVFVVNVYERQFSTTPAVDLDAIRDALTEDALATGVGV